MYKQEQTSITKKSEIKVITIRIADRLSDYKYLQDVIFACYQKNRNSGSFSI
jgi:hypothetical protein